MERPAHADPLHRDSAPSTQALPPLRVSYQHADVRTVLAGRDVLAVIGFGAAAQPGADPRYLRVALEPAEPPAPLEVWHGQDAVSCGSHGGVRWSSDGDYSFAALEVDEGDGGIAEAARSAYAALATWCRGSRTPHLLRLWNHFDAMNAGAGDAERYRHFCNGRAAGVAADFAANYPAASAIGTRSGRRVLQVYALAARLRGEAVANPRQWNAWSYPREYGPTAPGFARAMRAPARTPQLHISGTAAIVGHASHHPGDVRAQLEETLRNLDSLLHAAGSAHPLGSGSALKAYVRTPADVPVVRAVLRERFGANPPLVLLGDICRSELLVEIDGIHAG